MNRDNFLFEQPGSRSPNSRNTQTLPRNFSRFDTYEPNNRLVSGTFFDGDGSDPLLGLNSPSMASFGGGARNANMDPNYYWNSRPTGVSGFAPLGGLRQAQQLPQPLRGNHGAGQRIWSDSKPQHAFWGGGMPNQVLEPQQPVQQPRQVHDGDDELIPTAIVIKNIPFAVKKEQLVEVMNELQLPLPYAFNYHFDNGVFRGLAFANFTSPDETAAVISSLNQYELQGRKLRVEYKKMLPAQERERIEQEKRIKRGQLEEQHRPIQTQNLHNQHSISSLSSKMPATSPSPVSARNMKMGGFPQQPSRLDTSQFVQSPGFSDNDILREVNMNDPETLEFYTQLVSFRDDNTREAMIFPSTLTAIQRRTVHTLAYMLQLQHLSRGTGDQRQVHVSRTAPGQNVSPPIPQISAFHAEPSNRVLNRAVTIDFTAARKVEQPPGSATQDPRSAFYQNHLDPSGNYANRAELRPAKSHADLRAYTPSPVLSNNSFPKGLQTNFNNANNNGQRPSDSNGGSGATATPTLTPAASGSTLGQTFQDDGLLNGTFAGLNLGGTIGQSNGGSPRRARAAYSIWDTPPSATTPGSGPIGGHRSFSGMNAFNDPSRDRNQAMPIRQPAGPERGPGFSRNRSNGHQTRGSDDLRNQEGTIDE